jgi:hypothetical protein
MSKQQLVLAKKKKIQFYLQTKEVAKRLLKILTKHRGIEECVAKDELIREIWGLRIEELSELQYFFCVELIKKGMHFLRKKTHCQPVSLLIDGEFQYFIPVNRQEANMYEHNMRKNIEGIKAGITQIHKSVSQKWYNEIWYIGDEE